MRIKYRVNWGRTTPVTSATLAILVVLTLVSFLYVGFQASQPSRTPAPALAIEVVSPSYTQAIPGLYCSHMTRNDASSPLFSGVCLSPTGEFVAEYEAGSRTLTFVRMP